MSYYVLALSDWEDYVPYWFECDCSKEEFEEGVKSAIEYSLGQIDKPNGFINGYDILDIAVARLQEFHMFKLMQPDREIRIDGASYYSYLSEKPDVFSEDSWEKILQHNKSIEENFFSK